MKFKKIGLILAICSTFILTGCGDGLYLDREATTYKTQKKYVVTHITSIKKGTHLDEIVYNFVDETVEIYMNNEHIKEVSVKFNEDPKYAHHVEAYKRIFLEEVQKRGCAKVYGCQAAKVQLESKVADFKAQIASLEAAAADMRAELTALSEREAGLQQKLAVAHSQEQQNAETISNLEAALNDAKTQKQTIADNLAQYQALAESVLNNSGGE